MYIEGIDKQIASAMKNGNTLQLAVWRAIKTEFVKFRTSGTGVELTNDKELQIIQKMVLQRKESLELYRSAGRNELADVEEAEMNFLLTLLPQEPTETEITKCIQDFFNGKEMKPTMKDLRDVMAFIKTKFPTVNGGLVSKIFRENYI